MKRKEDSERGCKPKMGTIASGSTPLVSVIIPSFNRRAFLEEAVQSVVMQTLTGWELIVVDDGSTDTTWQWIQSQPYIHGIRHETRRGPSAARNSGASIAKAPYLAYLDSDDLFHPSKLEAQIEFFENNPDVALCHTNEMWIRNGKTLSQKPKHEKKGGDIFEHCLPLCRISPSAAMIRSDVFKSLGGFDTELEIAEDYELWLRLTAYYPVGFITDPLTIKRGGHADQLSEKYGMIETFRVEALCRVIEKCALTPEQHRAAVKELHKKCNIVAVGCKKRGRIDEANAYLARCNTKIP